MHYMYAAFRRQLSVKFSSSHIFVYGFLRISCSIISTQQIFTINLAIGGGIAPAVVVLARAGVVTDQGVSQVTLEERHTQIRGAPWQRHVTKGGSRQRVTV